MQKRQLGQTDVTVSAVTLGAWAIGGFMWGRQQEGDSLEAIRRSVEMGVTTIDTAPIYGLGRSEELIASALSAIGRDNVQILTKFGLRWDSTEGEYHFSFPANGRNCDIYKNSRPDSVIWECEQSLKRLRTEYIDLYQCHWRDPTTPVEETMQALWRLMRDGKVRAVGVSNYSLEELQEARRVIPTLASIQPSYSMLQRDIEKDLLPYCRANRIGVLPYSPLARGLLTGKVTMDRQFPQEDHRASHPLFQSDNRRRILAFLDKLRPVAAAHSATLSQLVINWTARQEGITSPLVGARNAAQAEENAKALLFRITDAQMTQIGRWLDDLSRELEPSATQAAR